MRTAPWRAFGAEALGTALLLWAIVASGIAVTSDRSLLAQLVPHAVAVGLGPVSGAHLNPAVTLAAVALDALPRAHAPATSSRD